MGIRAAQKNPARYRDEVFVVKLDQRLKIFPSGRDAPEHLADKGDAL